MEILSLLSLREALASWQSISCFIISLDSELLHSSLICRLE
ncbi:hypothetical protein [Helicobacter didelphidarum]|nr:hypothetical protein [Helicobacter didelphidarum]